MEIRGQIEEEGDDYGALVLSSVFFKSSNCGV